MEIITTNLIAIFALLVAIYGAMLSTYIIIRDNRREKRRLKVMCKRAIVATPEAITLVEIKAINIGHRPIKIISAGFHLSNGNKLLIVKDALGLFPLPKKLEDGESLSIHMDYSEFEEALAEQRKTTKTFYTFAFVGDVEGNDYTTRLPKIIRKRKLAK